MYLISVPTYDKFKAIQAQLMEVGKITTANEAVFISYHIPARKAVLAGRQGFSQKQLIGQFSNEELFDLQLPDDPADAVESIVDALVYSGKRKQKSNKNIGQLVKWEQRAKERLVKEASKYGADIESVVADIAVRVSAAVDEEE